MLGWGYNVTTYNQNFLETLPFSDLTVQIALAANTALTYTVPGSTGLLYRCEFSWPDAAEVWVGYNIAAVVPSSGTITQKNRIEMNPGRYKGARYVRGGDVLSFISRNIVTDASLSLLIVIK